MLTYKLKRLLEIESMEKMLDIEQLNESSNKNHIDVFDNKLKISKSSYNNLMNNQRDNKYSKSLDFLLESL